MGLKRTSKHPKKLAARPRHTNQRRTVGFHTGPPASVLDTPVVTVNAEHPVHRRDGEEDGEMRGRWEGGGGRSCGEDVGIN